MAMDSDGRDRARARERWWRGTGWILLGGQRPPANDDVAEARAACGCGNPATCSAARYRHDAR